MISLPHDKTHTEVKSFASNLERKLGKRNDELDLTPSAEKLNKTGNFFFKRGQDGKLNFDQYVGPSLYNLIPGKEKQGRNNIPRKTVYKEGQKLLKDLETSSVSTNSADYKQHLMQPKDLIYDGAITTGVNSLLLLNSRDGLRINNRPTGEYFSQRKEIQQGDFSAKKKSDCMIVVENLLEDLRVHTHGLPSQY